MNTSFKSALRNARLREADRECSARIEDGRMVCDCLTSSPEIRADIAVCYPKMTGLMEQLPPRAVPPLVSPNTGDT